MDELIKINNRDEAIKIADTLEYPYYIRLSEGASKKHSENKTYSYAELKQQYQEEIK